MVDQPRIALGTTNCESVVLLLTLQAQYRRFVRLALRSLYCLSAAGGEIGFRFQTFTEYLGSPLHFGIHALFILVALRMVYFVF